MFRKTILAAWSVLAVLGVSQNAAADLFPKVLVLRFDDSKNIYQRIIQPATAENYHGLSIVTKRFASADGAVRIDCAQTFATTTYSCAVTVDESKSKNGISKIQKGIVSNSIVFELTYKSDINFLVQNYMTTGALYSVENVNVKFNNGAVSPLPRFRFECPKDWVFDTVSCQGYIITR